MFQISHTGEKKKEKGGEDHIISRLVPLTLHIPVTERDDLSVLKQNFF